MRRNYQRVAIIAVLAAVSAALLVGATGMASAAENGTDETQTNDNGDVGSKCIDKLTGKPVVCNSDRWASLDGQTSEEVWLGLTIDAESMQDRYQRRTIESSSISNLTTAMMTEEGAVEFIKCYNDGEMVDQCKLRAVSTVGDFGSGIEASLMYAQTAQAERQRTWVEKVNGTGDLSVSDVFPNAGGSYKFDFVDRKYTLINGSEINVTQVVIYDTYYHNNEAKQDHFITWYDGEYRGNSSFGNEGLAEDHGNHDGIIPLNVRGPPSTNGSTTIAFDGGRYNESRQEIRENHQVAVDNVKEFADAWAQNYERGEVSAEEYASPAYRMRMHSTNYDDTGHYSYLMFAAQDRGMAVNIETAFTIEYTQVTSTGNLSNTTVGPVDGGLYATPGTFPNGTIESGKTYDFRAMNGTAWFIDKDGEQTTLNGTVTVVELRDLSTENNTVINSTTMQSSGFQTKSSDEFKQDVRDWMKQWEQQQEAEKNYNVTTNVTIPLFGDGGMPDVTPTQAVLLFLLFVGTLVAITSLIDAAKPF